MKTMTIKVPKPSKVRIGSGNDSSIQPIREENARLKTDISRLRIEKAQLRDQKTSLNAENVQLKAENLQLREDNDQLKEELYLIRQELKEEQEISELKDIELAKDNAWYQMLEEKHLRIEVE
jgi:uncharacterized protein (DUF3084 family)